MGRPRPLKVVQRRAVRLAGLALALSAIALGAGYMLIPTAVGILVRALDLTMRAGVWLVASSGSGRDWSDVAWSVGEAAVAGLTSPLSFAVLAGLVAVGAAAFYGLQRLLGLNKEESSP